MAESKIPKGYKQTEVGVIPEAWETTRLTSIADVRDGTHDSPKYTRSGVPFVTSKNIMEGKVNLEDITFISEEDARDVNKRSKVDRGDILLSMIGTVGNAALVDFEPTFCIKNVALIKPSFSRVKPMFLIQLFRSEQYGRHIDSKLDGGIQKFISLGMLRDIVVPLPPTKAEQEAIATVLSDVDTLIASLDQLIVKKRDLKQAAMQQLLSGKQRLPWFQGEWEVASFGSVFSKVNAKEHQIQTSEYQTTGIFPIVDQGKEPVIGFSDREGKRFRCPKDGVIIFGDHTCIVKFVDFDFVVGADGTQILAAKPGHCARFHAFQLQHRGIPTTGYNRHFKFLKERSFFSPPLAEQTAIAEVLSDMDTEIAALEQRRDKSRALKQGMMQKLLTGRIRLV